MNASNCVGGVVLRRESPSGAYEYYLIHTFGEGEGYSIFCRSKEGAAYFHDLVRDQEKALWLVDQLAEGEVSPFYLEEVLEEL